MIYFSLCKKCPTMALYLINQMTSRPQGTGNCMLHFSQQFNSFFPVTKDGCSHGNGGGTSGRAMAFCLGRPGSNPRLDFGFSQFRIVVNLFSLGVGPFLITCNGTVLTLPSSFLFPIIIYHCENYQL